MRSRLPSLNALRTFESAARHASFKGAADELCVTHSAVSHQIKQLEQALGVELFLRKPRSVELTRIGRSYYPILREAFDRISEGTDLVLNSKSHSTLTVQVYSTFAIRWLIPRMTSLSDKYPELKIRLHTSQSDVDFEHDDVDVCVPRR
jgi:LysR family glycine cleavage system transcriptional activator